MPWLTASSRSARWSSPPDPNSDATLFYVNNTIYGGSPKVTAPYFPNLDSFPKWKTRPVTFVATLLNGDHFTHSYMNVDFGGSRGWENEFQSSVAVGGSGCWFTFGATPGGLMRAVRGGSSTYPQ